MQYLLKRAEKVGCKEGWHYLMPFRTRRGVYDPTPTGDPAAGARCVKYWRPPKLKISFYCFRHHSITKLLQNRKVSEHTAVTLAGHIDKRMLKRYSHTQREVKRAAVMELERIAPQSVRVVEKVSKTAHK